MIKLCFLISLSILLTLTGMNCKTLMENKHQPDQVAITKVSLGFNSLKPSESFIAGKPHEEISVEQTPTGYKISVAINIPRADIQTYTEKNNLITQQEWKNLQTLIQNTAGLASEENEAEPVLDGSNLSLAFHFSNHRIKKYASTNQDVQQHSEIIKYLVNLTNKAIPDNSLVYLKNFGSGGTKMNQAF